MNFTLTSSQQTALAGFRAFLNAPEQVLMLKGAAGTGKTTLVIEFLKILDAENRPAVLMAPTGRAAYIIGSKTGRYASTIHRHIYGLSKLKSTSRNKDDEDDGGLHARFMLKGNEMPSNTVYIIDEASMISDSFSENEAFSFGSGRLMADLFEFVSGRKVVFVGDYAQLPPVGMNFSPALSKEYLENSFSCGVQEIWLREVLRQEAGSVILDNATKIRNSIENRTYVEFRLADGNDSLSEKVDLLLPYYQLSPARPAVKAAVIAYTNRQALEYNLAIRRHYFGDNAPRLKEGDLLMIARNNYSYNVELFNGNIVQVVACQPDGEMTKRTVRVKVGKDRIESVDLNFRKTTVRFGVGGKPVELTVTILDNFLDDPNGTVGGLLARALIVDFNNRLPSYIKDNLSRIKSILRSKKKLSIQDKEIYDAYLNLLFKDPYYNAVMCKYGYAMTCHKAQGGEWENVFVDMGRFGGTANEDYFRWAYTALTRGRRKIWRYRSPDFDYISNLTVPEIKPSARIKVSTYSDGTDFLVSRFNRMKALGEKAGMQVSEDRSKAYQQLIMFSDTAGKSALFQLWYSDKGYNGREILMNSASDELTGLCRTILRDSMAPDYVPFSAPGRPFVEKLVSFIRTQLEETGIQLLDITSEAYRDVFHVQTDGIAQICLTHTDKGNYTYMQLVSSLGPQDTKLNEFRKRFI
ncbi:MAG: AAA family ATPase [Muribaculaceae bacterium]|nr:AAA family ATPase [Muribaculaceae bacterium]